MHTWRSMFPAIPATPVSPFGSLPTARATPPTCYRRDSGIAHRLQNGPASLAPGRMLPATMREALFLMQAGHERYVLRKKPPGRVLASAHAVDREFRIIAALGAHSKVWHRAIGFLDMYQQWWSICVQQGQYWASVRRASKVCKTEATRVVQTLCCAVLLQVPVPQALCLCQDASVAGTPFYVMSFVGGRVYDDLALPELAPADRYQVQLFAVLKFSPRRSSTAGAYACRAQRLMSILARQPKQCSFATSFAGVHGSRRDVGHAAQRGAGGCWAGRLRAPRGLLQAPGDRHA